MATFRPIALAALLGLAQAAAPPPQQPQQSPPPQPPPRFRAETNLVRVDVYATKGGVALENLTADDFDAAQEVFPLLEKEIDRLRGLLPTLL